MLAALLAILQGAVPTLRTHLRRIVVPLRSSEMEAEVQAIVGWYGGFRPHMGLGGSTPNEIYRRRPSGP